ncbi:MAG: hypothetical protein NTZ10_06260 [Candidatus Saganbacteria bacterium]|nr:hypothetical protein [Candidatus Saganbacteria bacterium]
MAITNDMSVNNNFQVAVAKMEAGNIQLDGYARDARNIQDTSNGQFATILNDEDAKKLSITKEFNPTLATQVFYTT